MVNYRQVKIISGKGTSPDQFSASLNGIAIDPAGLLYAAGDSEVKVFDPEGKLLRRWPTEKPAICVAINDGGHVFVGEEGQIEQFDATGQRLDTWRDAERLGAVTAIDFFADHVLIADAKDRCLRRYDKTGTWLNNIGKDNRTKGFLIPNGYLDFSVDSEGIIHAANPAKHRVERYTMSGELLGHFGKFGMRRPEDFPGCCNPTNLTLTTKGHIIVTEKAAPRMKVFDSAGHLLAVVGAEFFDADCKNMDVAVDSQGRVYVIDTVHLNIRVFAPDSVESGDGISPESPVGGGVKVP